jgi:hypothetical protein
MSEKGVVEEFASLARADRSHVDDRLRKRHEPGLHSLDDLFGPTDDRGQLPSFGDSATAADRGVDQLHAVRCSQIRKSFCS